MPGANSDEEGPGDGVGRPVAVHCAPGRALERAKHVARWVVVSRDDPHGAMGREVGHLDDVMLEQEWLYLASRGHGAPSELKKVSSSQ